MVFPTTKTSLDLDIFFFQVNIDSTLLIIFAHATSLLFTRNSAILCASFFLWTSNVKEFYTLHINNLIY